MPSKFRCHLSLIPHNFCWKIEIFTKWWLLIKLLNTIYQDGERERDEASEKKKRRFVDDGPVEMPVIPGPGNPSPGQLTGDKVQWEIVNQEKAVHLFWYSSLIIGTVCGCDFSLSDRHLHVVLAMWETSPAFDSLNRHVTCLFQYIQ